MTAGDTPATGPLTDANAPATTAGAAGASPSRRAFGLTVFACLAGAGFVAYGSTRTWSLRVEQRPGLSDLRSATTGAADQPWLIGLALVALAGAGALLATRGTARRALGVLLILVGAGTAVGAVVGRAGLDPGAAGPGATFWPVVCVAGGALVAAGGLAAARGGHRWPTMGARYERRPAASTDDPLGARSEPSATAGPTRAETITQEPAHAERPRVAAEGAGAGTGAAGARADRARVDTRAAWDAIDRGDDPTER